MLTLRSVPAALVAGLTVASCALKDDHGGGMAVGTALQKATTEYTIQIPLGTEFGAVALLASGTLRVGDRVQVVDAAGNPATVATTGSGGAELGSGTRTGSVVSAGRVSLSGATVTGDVTSAGAITLQNGAVVTGVQRPNSPVTPFQSDTVTVSFDAPSRGPVQLEPPNGGGERVTTLAPGHYGNVAIKSWNRVNLTTGAYQFDSLALEPHARFVVDDTAGPVYLDVRDSLLFKGAIEGVSGQGVDLIVTSSCVASSRGGA